MKDKIQIVIESCVPCIIASKKEDEKDDLLLKKLIEKEVNEFDRSREKSRNRSKRQLTEVQLKNKRNYKRRRKKAKLLAPRRIQVSMAECRNRF